MYMWPEEGQKRSEFSFQHHVRQLTIACDISSHRLDASADTHADVVHTDTHED